MKQKIDKGYRTSELIFGSFGYGAAMIFNFVYQNYVPLMLEANLSTSIENKVISSSLLGFIMALDNILAIALIPIFGNVSDHTRSRYGKRLPFMLVGIPICSILFIFIPLMARLGGKTAVIMMAVAILIFNVVYFIWRTPCHAVMGDIVPEKYQSDGNAVFNIAGACAMIISLASASILEKTSFGSGIATGDYTSIFIFGSIVALILLVCLFFGVKWKDNRNEEMEAPNKGKNFLKMFSLKEIGYTEETKHDLILVLVIAFCLSGASDAASTYYSLFATKTLGLTASKASSINAIGTVFAVLLAIPAGIVARKKSKGFAIKLGAALTAISHILMIGISVANLSDPSTALTLAMIFNLGSFVFITVNTVPLLIAATGCNHVGASIGVYQLVKTIAASILPIIFGAIIGAFNNNYNLVHIICASLYVIGFVVVGNIKVAGPIDEKEQAKIEEAMKEIDDND